MVAKWRTTYFMFSFLILSLVSKSGVEFFCKASIAPGVCLTAIKMSEINLQRQVQHVILGQFCIKDWVTSSGFVYQVGSRGRVLKHPFSDVALTFCCCRIKHLLHMHLKHFIWYISECETSYLIARQTCRSGSVKPLSQLILNTLTGGILGEECCALEERENLEWKGKK